MKHGLSPIAFGVFALALALVLPVTAVAAPPEAPQQQPKPPVPATVQFRIIFNAYDGDPKKPEDVTFQVNTLDVRQPTGFLKLGETIPKTKLKLLKFEEKLRHAANSEVEDLSELTVINTETQETTVLVIAKVSNLPSAR